MRELSKNLFLLVALVLFTLGCISEKEEREQPDLESIEILPEVVFTVVGNEPLRFFIESRGVVEPVQKIQITPRIGGFVEESKIVEGQPVNRGEVLLQFNRDEWEFSKQEAYNAY